ncbi:hypothetical protein FQA39_LY04052 [Lamprigera yunnana]|nr:hypothetical protein FQA39_LY04052 [Lamprigera yunnana]
MQRIKTEDYLKKEDESGVQDVYESQTVTEKMLVKNIKRFIIPNIQPITTTSLRKHIATIAQLISMDDHDLEQWSIHLGHKKATHMNYYRKTDDKLQIAKVSNLLLVMEKKSINEYRELHGAQVAEFITDAEKKKEDEDIIDEGGKIDLNYKRKAVEYWKSGKKACLSLKQCTDTFSQS